MHVELGILADGQRSGHLFHGGKEVHIEALGATLPMIVNSADELCTLLLSADLKSRSVGYKNGLIPMTFESRILSDNSSSETHVESEQT